MFVKLKCSVFIYLFDGYMELELLYQEDRQCIEECEVYIIVYLEELEYFFELEELVELIVEVF